MGAWIETFRARFLSLLNQSHPTWVRGLKLFEEFGREWNRVAPYVGAWIETRIRANDASAAASHPTWVRGLKLHVIKISYYG